MTQDMEKTVVLETAKKKKEVEKAKDLEKRLAAHNAGTASKYTRTRVPVELVFAAPCADRSAASKREMEIKSLKRAEKLVLIQSSLK